MRIHLIIYKALLILLIFSGIFDANGQNPVSNGGNGTSRLYLGGNFGLSFGTLSTVYIAPTIAYGITEKLYAGSRITYQYLSDRRYVPYYNVSTYGGSLFLRYYVFQDLFAHLEYEKLFYKDSYSGNNNPISSYDGLYAGAGYRQWIGPRAYTTILLLFDLQNDNYTFGINPFIRIGMGFGI